MNDLGLRLVDDTTAPGLIRELLLRAREDAVAPVVAHRMLARASQGPAPSLGLPWTAKVVIAAMLGGSVAAVAAHTFADGVEQIEAAPETNDARHAQPPLSDVRDEPPLAPAQDAPILLAPAPKPVPEQAGNAKRPRSRRGMPASASENRSAIDPPPAEEARLLLAARRSLTRDPARALELADAHASRFPNGRLSQERESIAIRALARLGRVEAARRRAKAFDRAFSSSPHADAVRRALDSLDDRP